MPTDHKKLISPLRKAPILNKLLDSFLIAGEEVEKFLDEAFRMLNINECSGEWLDNLGLLLGVARPVIDLSDRFLKTDNPENSLDTAKYYVTNAPIEQRVTLVDDEYYRKLIKAQIIKNSIQIVAINDLEFIADLILGRDIFNTFYIECTNFANGDITVHVDDKMSHDSLAFIQNFSKDSLGRKKFHFPYPPQVKNVSIRQE